MLVLVRFLIEIQSMQAWTATARQELQEKQQSKKGSPEVKTETKIMRKRG